MAVGVAVVCAEFCIDAFNDLIKACQMLFCLGEEGVGHVDVTTIVGLKERKLDCFRVVCFKKVVKHKAVAK